MRKWLLVLLVTCYSPPPGFATVIKLSQCTNDTTCSAHCGDKNDFTGGGCVAHTPGVINPLLAAMVDPGNGLWTCEYANRAKIIYAQAFCLK
jgi:hypothetical protein